MNWSAASSHSLTRETLNKDCAIRMDVLLRNSRIKLQLGQVFWREVGQGPVLVFLHGSWCDSSQWLPVIEHLSQNYHCFAPDLLGFGDSERPKLHYSVQLEVECLLEYLEALHMSQVYLIGHSLGGWIAASYALKHLDRVSGLVLLAPEGVRAEGNWESWQRTRWLVGHPPIAHGILRWLYPLARLFGRHKPIQQALEQRQQMLRSPAACKLLFRRRRAEIQAELLQERLEFLNVPTLILQGENDAPEAIARSQIYAAQTPNSQLQMIDRGGNDLPEALSNVVAESIHNFVKGVEGWKEKDSEG
jgi:pimeloyl-ACP methyl ester carboxylesterase